LVYIQTTKRYKQKRGFKLKLEGNDSDKNVAQYKRMREGKTKRKEMDMNRKLKANRRRNGKPQRRS